MRGGGGKGHGMKQRLIGFAAGVSLLAFLAAVTLLVLSITRPGQVVSGTGPGSLILRSSGGELSITRGHYDPVADAVYVERPGDAWHVQYIYLAAITAVMPLAWLVHRQRERTRRRLLERKCVNCGYDLRGSGDACPECGVQPGQRRG